MMPISIMFWIDQIHAPYMKSTLCKYLSKKQRETEGNLTQVGTSDKLYPVILLEIYVILVFLS